MGTVKEYIRLEKGGKVEMIGGVHELWVGLLQDQLSNGEIRPMCGVWLPGQEYEAAKGVEVGVEGYELDIGRKGDEVLVSLGFLWPVVLVLSPGSMWMIIWG